MVINIVETLELRVPNLYSEEQPLINISSGFPATQELVANAKSPKERDEADRNSFFWENCYI